MLKDVKIDYDTKSRIMLLLKGILQYRDSKNNENNYIDDVLITLKTVSDNYIFEMLEMLNNDNVKTEAWFHEIAQYQNYRNSKK